MPRGGYRPGSGPKKGTKYKKRKVDTASDVPADIQQEAFDANLTPLEYMLKIMRDPGADQARRDRMAAQAAPFVHKRAGDLGAKSQAKDRAAAAATGKFSPMPAPTILPFRNKPR